MKAAKAADIGVTPISGRPARRGGSWPRPPHRCPCTAGRSAEAHRFHLVVAGAQQRQRLLHRLGALLAQRQVVLAAAALVGMAFDGDASWCGRPSLGIAIDGRGGTRPDDVAVEVEEHHARAGSFSAALSVLDRSTGVTLLCAMPLLAPPHRSRWCCDSTGAPPLFSSSGTLEQPSEPGPRRPRIGRRSWADGSSTSMFMRSPCRSLNGCRVSGVRAPGRLAHVGGGGDAAAP